MAKVKLNLDRLTDGEMILKAKEFKTKLTGNANFTVTTPSQANYATMITDAEAALAASDAANATAKQKTTEKNVAMDILRKGTAQLGTNIESLSGGDPVKIQSAGMDVKAPKTPAGVPAQVMNLFITAGDESGELDFTWDPVPGTWTYEVQMCAEAMFTTGVIALKTVTKSQAVAEGLTSGTRMWARVRATNAAGTGAWSDVATKIVP